MTCADTTMLRSVMQHATAHYIATALFAITLVVARGLRILWRRRPRRGGYRKRRPRRRGGPGAGAAPAPEGLLPTSVRPIPGTGHREPRMGIRVAATAGPNCSRGSVITVLLSEPRYIVPDTRFARR
ncbi:hypothetical protein GCM10010207_66900 [Streptomyces atratus]|nr:hypothetical protein GCM10010207_66900 [Streptomyces atratus]